MVVEKFFYKIDTGWSLPHFPQLDSDQTLVLIFGSPVYRNKPEVISLLTNAYPKAHIVGCSSAGEIFGQNVLDDSLSVAVIRFSSTQLKVASEPVNDASESCTTGEKLAKKFNTTNLAGIMIFSDGLKINGSQLVQGINSGLPKGTIVTGGLAGDGSNFTETWVIQNRQAMPGYVTAVGFYGNKIKLGHGSKGGWDIFGPERNVTRSENNVLYELDGKPALKLYKEYLGDKAAELPASGLLFPLQIRLNKNEDKKIVRTILSIDEEKQALIFAGDIPQGSLAQLMKANFDRLIEGASNAATNIAETSLPMLVIAISCVGRRLVLGERTEEELEATLEKFPAGTDLVGFYSYGEISPYVTGSACELHNQTMTLTAISEET